VILRTSASKAVPADKDAAFRTAAALVETDFERGSGSGGGYTFTMRPNVAVTLREESVVQARETIEKRVNELGVAEPTIAQQGENNDQILVELPGVTDVEHARNIIQSTGMLELKLVERQAGTREELAPGGADPQGMEVLPGSGDAGAVFYLLKKAPVVTGRELRSARQVPDENNRPAVSFTLNSAGAQAFGKATGRKHRTAAGDRPRQTRAVGAANRRPYHDRRSHLRQLHDAGSTGSVAHPAVGCAAGDVDLPRGTDDRRESWGRRDPLGRPRVIVGLLLIVAFMLIYYRLSGVNAVVALVANLVILLGLMAYIGAVMTLPGIAGFVLTMGIGVDSNVLIFERIKEELEAGRGVRAAINAGFSRVFWTLFDTHIAALISVIFLFQFGTGPIRGFAVTLFFGLMSNLFTSIFVSKTLFEVELSRRHQTAALSI
jgi:preprotein translocase subunit SecD